MTVQSLQAEIQAEFGFFPPFFAPALSTPAVLASLWQQTLSAYVRNPLPKLFKEKLAALLARYCKVPYCLVCHSSSLSALGMRGSDIYDMLAQRALTDESMARDAAELAAGPLERWPEPGSQTEQAILSCSIAIHLQGSTANCHQKLRRLLGKARYNDLMLFLTYNKVALSWAEAHPELSYAEDRRAIDHLGNLLGEEPRLAALFARDRTPQDSALPHEAEARQVATEAPRPALAAPDEQRARLAPALLDCMPLGLWATSVAGDITFVNQVALDLFGYAREQDMVGHNAHDLVHHTRADGRPYAKKDCPIFQSLPSGRAVCLLSETFWRADGSSFVGEYRSKPLIVGDQLMGTVISVTDITEERRAQRELQHLFLLTGDLVAVVDAEKQITKVNPAWTAVLGYSEEEVVGRPIDAFLPDFDWHRCMSQLAQARDGAAPVRGEAKSVHRSGAARWLRWTAVLSETTNSLYLVASDFTEGKQRQIRALAQERRRADLHAAQKRRLQQLFARAPVAIGVLSGANKEHTVINAQHEHLFGSGQHLLGKPIDKALPSLATEAFCALLDQVYRTGMAAEGKEFPILRSGPDGTPQPTFINFVLQPIAHEDADQADDDEVDGNQGAEAGASEVTDVLFVAYDVTDLVQARKFKEQGARALSATVEQLTHERKLREQFVAALSHDLRTPITAASLAAQSLQRRAASQSETKQPGRDAHAAQRIVRSLERADGMIRDLLDANRLKAGEGLPLHKKPTQLSQLVRRVVTEAGQVHGARMRLAANSAGDVSGSVDAGALARVLENLLSNAVKYGRPEGPVTTRLSVADHWAKLTVHNEGEAIAAAEQQVLFEPYQRTSAAQRGSQVGWGIGLTLVKGIVEAHGGTVAVHSEQGAGTTFAVQLPLSGQRKQTS